MSKPQRKPQRKSNRVPPHRMTTGSLLGRLEWAGVTLEDEHGNEHVAVAFMAPIAVIEAAVERLETDPKAEKKLGALLHDVVAAVYAEGQLGDWPFGDDVSLSADDDGYDVDADDGESEDDDTDDVGLNPERDLDLDDHVGWDEDDD